jgi:hypothetical protein
MQKTLPSFFQDGYIVKKNIVPTKYVKAVESELLSVANFLDSRKAFTSLDECWNYHKSTNRVRAGKIYNAFKYLCSVHSLATSKELQSFLTNDCGVQIPGLVDVNCRIDSRGEEHYLFGWHQDYWFSVCSPKAVVAWIPITGLSPENGGLEVISNKLTNSRIFKSKGNKGAYNSYADAVLIDENVGHYETTKITELEAGDGLVFSFDVLHRSLPVNSIARSRFTIQLRFADFKDPEFSNNDFKPGMVSRNTVDYIREN